MTSASTATTPDMALDPNADQPTVIMIGTPDADALAEEFKKVFALADASGEVGHFRRIIFSVARSPPASART